MLARFDEVHEEIIEVQRMLRQRFVQGRACLDIRLDGEHQLLHRRLFMSVADDVEALHHRNAGLEHGRELTREESDVLGLDLLAALEELRLLLHPFRQHALTSQVGLHGGFRSGEHLALDAFALLVGAFPDELELLSGSYLGHGYCPELIDRSIQRCTG